MTTQHEKAVAFARLHEQPHPFVIPNPWDAGSAKEFGSLGFSALATTSYGLAASLGRRDGARAVSRDEALAHARAIVEAVDLPVSADLEHGYGDNPTDVARTIRLAAVAGLVGASIEDATGLDGEPIYAFDIAVERIAAAAEAARALPFPFTLTARAENYLHDVNDLDDTIARLVAYERAGADVLYAPMLPDADAIRAVCAALSKPVNVLAWGPVLDLSLDELADLGVRRVSTGSMLYNLAQRTASNAARSIAATGRFDALSLKR